MKTVLKSPTVTLYCSKAGSTVRPYQIKTRWELEMNYLISYSQLKLCNLFPVLQSHQEQDCKMQPVQCRLCRKQGILRGEV